MDAILMCSDVTMQAEDPYSYKGANNFGDISFKYIPKGPKIDVGLIKALDGIVADQDTRELINNLERTKKKLFELPFDQKLARQVVAFKISDDMARVVVKGNPEIVLPFCE